MHMWLYLLQDDTTVPRKRQGDGTRHEPSHWNSKWNCGGR